MGVGGGEGEEEREEEEGGKRAGEGGKEREAKGLNGSEKAAAPANDPRNARNVSRLESDYS